MLSSLIKFLSVPAPDAPVLAIEPPTSLASTTITIQSLKAEAERTAGQCRSTYRKSIVFGAILIGADEAPRFTAVEVVFHQDSHLESILFGVSKTLGLFRLHPGVVTSTTSTIILKANSVLMVEKSEPLFKNKFFSY